MPRIDPPDFETVLHDQPHPLLFVTIGGPHLFEIANEKTPYDLCGVFIKDIEELVGLIDTRDTYVDEGEVGGRTVHLTVVEVRRFLEQLLKKDGTVLEQLYSPHIVEVRWGFEELRVLASRCVTKHHHYHYISAFRKQWNDFLLDDVPHILPLLQTYRILLTGVHLMKSGRVECSLLKLKEEFGIRYLDELIDKQTSGVHTPQDEDIDVEFHEVEVQRLVEQLIDASGKSELPDEPGSKRELNDFLVRLRLG